MTAREPLGACRVEIHAGGRDIIVEHQGPLKPITDRALALWRATAPKPGKTPTKPDDGGEGGGAGFVLADRADLAGLMPAELELPNRLANGEEGDDVRRRTGF